MSDPQLVPSTSLDAPTPAELGARHFRIGWAALATFVALGVVLDSLHAFKIGFYLDANAESRRFLWTLAHAHGIGLGLLHLAQGATLRADLFCETNTRLRLASASLTWASVLMPAGFFLGGLAAHGSDPSIGIFLVPLGGIALLLAATLMAVAVFRATSR